MRKLEGNAAGSFHFAQDDRKKRPATAAGYRLRPGDCRHKSRASIRRRVNTGDNGRLLKKNRLWLGPNHLFLRALRSMCLAPLRGVAMERNTDFLICEPSGVALR